MTRDPDNQELACKLTLFYDSQCLIWQRLHRENKLTRGEIDMLWASHKNWAELMIVLGLNTDKKVLNLRGFPYVDGEYDFEQIAKMQE